MFGDASDAADGDDRPTAPRVLTGTELLGLEASDARQLATEAGWQVRMIEPGDSIVQGLDSSRVNLCVGIYGTVTEVFYG